ncbi:hypothetical protein ACH5RR_040027 [Cinchona calisaya]|uniref:Aspartic peptidase DDI1-type domain-containing protein n=1 Tax=Cinchona calisaya TaxID=153742 RepID=A0ABD2Y3J3_9GENT
MLVARTTVATSKLMKVDVGVASTIVVIEVVAEKPLIVVPASRSTVVLLWARKMAHDIPTGVGNTLPERMTRQEQALSQLLDRLGDLPVGYILMNDLREIKAISTVLREHMRTVDASLDSLWHDLAVTKKVCLLAKVNGIDVLAMVDIGATHSFVTGREVCRLKLEMKEHMYRIKDVNAEAQLVLGVASVELTLGQWYGKCNLMAVLLDDFDLILGKEFMATNRIFPIPHLDGVMIADERCPSFIPTIFVKTDSSVGPSSSGDRGKWDSQISAIQLENGLIEIKADMFQELPDCCMAGLDEFADIMPSGCLRCCPLNVLRIITLDQSLEQYPRLKLHVAWSWHVQGLLVSRAWQIEFLGIGWLHGHLGKQAKLLHPVKPKLVDGRECHPRHNVEDVSLCAAQGLQLHKQL